MDKGVANLEFSEKVKRWGREHGRADLPWQQQPSPYRVWVSEVMLQQTQVSTVIPYYQRFMERFPSLEVLSQASQDEVLHLWSGLGYYSRARNLHKAAQHLVSNHNGRFPNVFEDIQALPGVGRSTAGAILSLSMGQAFPILDGNVKRVFCRCFGISDWPGKSTVQKQLWALVEQYLPDQDVGLYNQTLMDLGATVCSRKRPACVRCPLAAQCEAFLSGQPEAFPVGRPKRAKPVKSKVMLVLRDPSGAVLLELRAASGIWGGLWSFPEFEGVDEASTWVAERFSVKHPEIVQWPTRRHSFTHFELDMLPVELKLNTPIDCVMDAGRWVWYNIASPEQIGIAAPVKNIIEALNGRQEVVT